MWGWGWGCCIVWDSIGETQIKSLQKLQNRAAQIITGASYLIWTNDVLHQLGWLNLAEQRQYQKAIMMFKIINGLTPSYLSDMFTRTSSLSDYGLRSSRINFELPKNRTNYFKNSFHLRVQKFGTIFQILLRRKNPWIHLRVN